MMAIMMRMIKKILLMFGAMFAGLILLAAVCLMALPHAVSSKWFKHRLEAIMEDTIKHGVDFKDIGWSWRRGITVSGVTLRDHPDFSDEILAAVDHISLKIEWIRLIRGRLVFDVRIVAPRINIIRTADGRINIVDGFAKSDPKAQLAAKDDAATGDISFEKETLPAESKPVKQAEFPVKPFSLPVDIAGRFELIDFSLVLDDRRVGRHIAITNAGIRLDLPSVKTEAIRLALHVDLAVDHEPVPRSSILVAVHNLFDKAGILAVHDTVVDAEINLPGFKAVLAGDMKNAGIKGEVNADLHEIADLAYLFAPGLAEQMRPVGRIHLAANGSGMPDAPVAFDIRVSGDDLGFSGTVIDNRSLSSGAIRIHAVGAYDPREDDLVIDTGQIQLLNNTEMELSGKFEGLTSEEPLADVTLTSLDLHLDEVAGFLTDFIPDILVLPGSGGPSLLSIRQLVFSGGLKTGPARVFCEKLGLDLPHLILAPADGNNRMTLYGGRLTIADMQTALMTFFPVSAELTAAIRADAFDLTSNERIVSINNVDLDKLQIRGDNIQTAPDSPFAVAGTFALVESMKVDAVSLAPVIDIKQLRQFLQIIVSISADGRLKTSLDPIHLNIGGITIFPKNGKSLELSCSLNAAVPELSLSKIEPLTVDLSGFKADMAVDKDLTFTLRADALDTGRSMIRGRANLRADLTRLSEKFKGIIEPDIAAGGILDLELKIDGRLPDEKAMAGLKNLRLNGNLDFLNSVALTALLLDGRMDLDPDKENRLTLGTISGDPLLSYTFNGRTGDGKLFCRLRVGNIDGIPGMMPDPVLTADLIAKAEHRFLSAIDLDQHLNIDPVGIRQAAAISIDGVDRLFDSGGIGTPYAALSRVGATISAGIDVADLSRIKGNGIVDMPDMDLSGSISARTRLHLIPGNRITGDVAIDIDRVNLDLKDMVRITGADAGLEWSKTFRILILDPEHPDRMTDGILLSQRVLHPETPGELRLRASGNDIYRHLKQLKERSSPSSEISFNFVSMQKGSLPINMGPSRIVLDVVNGLPGISYFQFDLLGGTVNGSISLLQNQKDSYIRSSLNFSGVNTAAFFPELYSGSDDPRAEIRGMVYADIPITHQMPVLLENMAISIEFTKIGSRAIERLLYALDPNESNEAVMAQRRILRNGSPKWIRMDIRDGLLSIRGEVTVRNINIALPVIQRFNIARLPGIEKYAPAAAPLETIALLLGRLSAETLAVSSDGRTIFFK